MTACDVYVGELNDPSFQWDGGNWSGNVPDSTSPIFPPTKEHYNGEFHEWVEKTGVVCKKTDYSGWVAIVNKAQIMDYLDYAYGNHGIYHGPDAWPGCVESLAEVKRFADALDPEKDYGLVACEW